MLLKVLLWNTTAAYKGNIIEIVALTHWRVVAQKLFKVINKDRQLSLFQVSEIDGLEKTIKLIKYVHEVFLSVIQGSKTFSKSESDKDHLLYWLRNKKWTKIRWLMN